MQRQINN